MRFLFRTDYAQDIRLITHRGEAFWYGLLMLLLSVAPIMLPEFWLAQLNLILVYSLVGLGMMILLGYTGQLSLGHAAFFGLGAFVQAYLVNRGWPLLGAFSCTVLANVLMGALIALPALRVKGIFLGIATLALGLIVEEVLIKWESFTNGTSGLNVKPAQMLGIVFNTQSSFFYLALGVVLLSTLLTLNLLRSPTGRALVAIRDSEISAQSMGIHAGRIKIAAFMISGAFTGLGGALYAHYLRHISPENFTLLLSLDFAFMVIIGGLASIHGVFFGAMFIVLMPPLIAIGKDFLPQAMANTAGLQNVVYGLILVAVVLFEPRGLYGRWLKTRAYFQLFPFYRRGMFRRQRAFQKSERLH
ncbi:MAG: branched-chain amino acid ABC transporter permease [Burkholderiaceae bacterium]|nr:branched-chain amino acid ABC transporter permease [Burkholderiaceae bacterium]